jgi:hypothetical protein
MVIKLPFRPSKEPFLAIPAQSTHPVDPADPVASGGVALDALRFIPFSRRDLQRMLIAERRLNAQQAGVFQAGTGRISDFFRDEFHALRQSLKSVYAGLDPDADTRRVAAGEADSADSPAELLRQLTSLLNRGNYEALGDADLKRAFRRPSLFQIRLQVDLKDFDDVLLYCRGASERSETIRVFFGMFKRQLQFVNYERVVLYLRFADRGQPADSEFPPGRVMIKLFQNVPDADLEMLFPNTRVAMRWIDRLLIGVPALASGVVVASTKLAAPLLLLGTLVGYWLGLHAEPVSLDKRGLLLIAAGFAALGAYLWKQWSTYRNRKARFRQALTRNLYFKLLDNNAGVLLRVLDDAEESECKEALVALYFLLAMPDGATSAALDAEIEAWFASRWSARLDFEIDDALQKLSRLGLAEESGGYWQATGKHQSLTQVAGS